MTAWLAANAALVYFTAIVGGFAVVAIWETCTPLRPASAPVGRRWTVNIALLCIDNLAVHALLPVAALGAAMHAQAQGWGLLPRLGAPGPALVLVGLLSMDLLRWLLHLAMHRLSWLWRLHSVHHSDTDYDCTIGLRFHPLEALLSAVVLVAAVSALGVPPGIVVLSEALTLALGFFAHGNVSLPPRWDRMLRLVLVTADTHRIHHSCLRRESMSNFGSVFSFWDRLFGTYTAAPAAGPLGMSIGLAELREPAQLTLARLLLMPFRRPAAPGSEPSPLCRPGGRGLG
jgi:sterol desaturase/sphingolipid hydroxylase (fatty acid hydroxylase superfamily)